ncbi:MAG TPA: hypothetical protein VK797_31085 [Tepidisphaeraceae bacterium]|jgi:hypothetical protein|nr:hypothetical protein [Tepidisphaeraceae bacterium]
MRRRLFALASAVSLLLCVATLGFWPSKRQTTIFMVPLPTGLSVGIDAGADSIVWVRDQFAIPQEIDVTNGRGMPRLDPSFGLWLQARAEYEGDLLIWKWGSYHLLDGGRGMGHEYGRDDGIVRWFAMPPWVAAAILAALPTMWIRKWLSRPRAGSCQHCGYNLIGNTSGVCPECGTPVPKAPDQKSPRPA